MITFVGKAKELPKGTISFVKKTVEVPKFTPGKRVAVKVVWKNNRFVAKKDKDCFEIVGWDDLSKSKWVYALPTNSYFTPWHRKDYIPIADRNALEMTLRFWGKYRHGMTIYGKIVDGMFNETK